MTRDYEGADVYCPFSFASENPIFCSNNCAWWNYSTKGCSMLGAIATIAHYSYYLVALDRLEETEE